MAKYQALSSELPAARSAMKYINTPLHLYLLPPCFNHLPIPNLYMAVTPAMIAILFLTALLLQRPPATAGQEVEDEREFSYKLGSDNGPENWGHIHKEWAACGAGSLQSPIDLSDDRVSLVDGLGPLRRTYRPAYAVMKNRGHDIMLQWEENTGGVWINGSAYSLKQLHWHSLSEHTVNGGRYLMEVHMVHESADKKLAVVGILYKEGRPDDFLAEMESYIRKLVVDEKDELSVGAVNPMHVQWGSRKYYRYMGSLTTPPCTEGVIWTIIKKVRTVSRDQLRLLREAVHDEFVENSRPTQPTNERGIYLHRPKEIKF